VPVGGQVGVERLDVFRPAVPVGLHDGLQGGGDELPQRLPLLAAAEDSGITRWETYLRPLPDRFRDGDLRDIRLAAMRARAAYGPKDSIRDALPADLTEPFLESVDRLLKALARRELRSEA